MEIYGSIKLRGSLVDGTGDPLLTKDEATDSVGVTSNAFGNLQDGFILVGNASNEPTAVSVSGDISITNTGVASITAGSIVNADVNASAGISVSKLQSVTASRALVSDASGFVSPATTTATQIGYLSDVTGLVQNQLNGKQATITGAGTTITSANLTANRALLSNASGKVAVSSVTNVELGYISGLTSSAQAQLNTKLAPTISSVATGDILYYNGSAWVNLPRGTNGQALYSNETTVEWNTPTINGIPIGGSTNQVLAKQSGTDFDADWETLTVSSITDLTSTAAELNILDGATITVSELNYLLGLSSPVQSQLNTKLSSTLPQNAILVGNSSNVATALPAGASGYVLTSVSGVPAWQPVSAGTTPGSNTQVLFNDAGSFGADADLTYNKTTNVLSIADLDISDIGIDSSEATFYVNASGGDLNLSGTALVTLSTAATERLRINSSGAFGLSGANYGTAGQVLTSNGSSSAPTWASGGIGGSISAGQVAYGSGVNTIKGESVFTYNDVTDELTVRRIKLTTGGAFSAVAITGALVDPTTLTDGDIWYNTTSNKFRVRENGSSVNLMTSSTVLSGTYTPTFTAVANCSGITSFDSQYLRVGNVVTVSGRVGLTVTSGTTTTTVGISIPIASNFTITSQCSGTGNQTLGNVSGVIIADSTNDRAELTFTSSSSGVAGYAYIFTYVIV